ncbi:MAG: hypothetical protein ACPG4T_23545, partial [Nannocystaceae bacterium]
SPPQKVVAPRLAVEYALTKEWSGIEFGRSELLVGQHRSAPSSCERARNIESAGALTKEWSGIEFARPELLGGHRVCWPGMPHRVCSGGEPELPSFEMLVGLHRAVAVFVAGLVTL